MSALHTHSWETHTHRPEFTVFLVDSGELNFTVLPPVAHTPGEGCDFK